MSFAHLEPVRRRVLFMIWLAGAVSLAATMIFSVTFTTPYRTTWAWISFIAMVVVEDVVRRGRPGWGWRLPMVTLVAAAIAFRKHPDVSVLVVLSAAPLASLLLRQAWFTLLGKTASWIIAVAVGSAALGLVGFGNTPHFVAATAVLILLVATLDSMLWWFQAGAEAPVVTLSWRVVIRRFAGALAFGALGAGLALGWRTPSVGPVVLRLGEICVLGVIGMLIGFALGGTARGPVGGRLSVRRLPASVVLGGGLLLVSTRVPDVVSATLAAAGLVALGVLVVRHRAYYGACLVLGGLCNEIARAANGGRMPVETADLPPALRNDFAGLTRDSGTYLVAGPGTALRWLADRFPVPIFPGVASIGDILVAIGIIWLAAALTMGRPSADIDADRGALAA
ncbi:MAG: hypothetical protein E6J01_06135 [Chloroflexi bacterium]|nr:MAG: hypothetical protein E6J01_06135 [Chloroflexota bacterium]